MTENKIDGKLQGSPEKINIPTSKRGADGRVNLYFKEVKKDGKVIQKAGYRRVYSVDAREAIAYGNAVWLSPEDSKAKKAAHPNQAKADKEKETGDILAKASLEQLESIIIKNGIELNLDEYDKIGEAREAVKVALLAAENGSDDE